MSVLSKVHTIKPINGKISDDTLEVGPLIVPKKQDNACGGKGLADNHLSLYVGWRKIPKMLNIWRVDV